MATIDDLPLPDFSQLSDEELLEMIKGVRARRRDQTSAAHTQAKKKAVAKSKKGKAVALSSINSMLQGLTDAQKKEVLARLQAMASIGDSHE